MPTEFITFLAVLVVSALLGLPKEERFTHIGVKHTMQFVLCGLGASLILWVFVFTQMWESFLLRLDIDPSAWQLKTWLDGIRAAHTNPHLGSSALTNHELWLTSMGISNEQVVLSSAHAPIFSTTTSLSFLIACFVTLGVFFCLMLTRQSALVSVASWYILALTGVSIIFIFSDSVVTLFICFECLLLLALGLLKLTSKSERISEAISEMFMWTLFGSLFLLLGVFSMYNEMRAGFSAFRAPSVTTSLTGLLFLIGFGVKVPTWPFFSWLLKAHVEASVEFSILLSGFIVKLGLLGLWRILDMHGCDWLYRAVAGLSCLAIIDATLRLFAQVDLKRIVALTTVIEMNWLNFCYMVGDAGMLHLAHFLVVVHCFTTTSEFLLVEYVSKRYNSRNYWQIVSLWYQTPVLWYVSFLVVFTTVGFPGTSIFFAKFIFLSSLLSISYGVFFFFLVVFFIMLPLFFVRLWVPLWFGSSAETGAPRLSDLTARELALVTVSAVANIVLGVVPGLFFGLF